MHISRIVIRNFRCFKHLDVSLIEGLTTVIGENNTGKSNLLYAIRIILDSSMSSQYRQLQEHDLFSGSDFGSPNHVIISVEFSGYSDNDNECGLVGCWEVSEGIARLNYRFRLRNEIREAIINEDFEGEIALEDYHWEITGGGANDPATVEWHESLGSSIRIGHLQHYQLLLLQALRNVSQDLRQSRVSPLNKLFSVSGIPEEEKEELIETIRNANEEVSSSTTIANEGVLIEKAFQNATGEAHSMNIRLGMADPTFSSIAKALTILLSNNELEDFEPSRNGLGLNNVLYISMLISFFDKRIADNKTAGQLLLIEEPEAHLHPQLQRVLFKELKSKSIQTIVTTHSTHISSQASLNSVIILSNTESSGTIANVPASSGLLDDASKNDLERYLDATRSSLLFAKKVILVEGPSELYLIPKLLENVLGIDLDRVGITVIAINGKHFSSYTKLFSDNGLLKKCAVVADGDFEIPDVPELEDDIDFSSDLTPLENDLVKVFQCKTTFERAIVHKKTIEMICLACEELNAPRTLAKLRKYQEQLNVDKLKASGKKAILNEIRSITLALGKRFGKARFSQILSKHANHSEYVPKYIHDAIDWILE